MIFIVALYPVGLTVVFIGGAGEGTGDKFAAGKLSKDVRAIARPGACGALITMILSHFPLFFGAYFFVFRVIQG